MSQAWILDIGCTLPVAIGSRELLQLISAPQPYTVPLAPAYCQHVVAWQDRLLAVMDLSQRLTASAQSFTENSLLAVVAFQSLLTHQVEVAAIMLTQPPHKVEVSNQDALPADQDTAWGNLAISGFTWQQKPIAILDLGRVFAPMIGAQPLRQIQQPPIPSALAA